MGVLTNHIYLPQVGNFYQIFPARKIQNSLMSTHYLWQRPACCPLLHFLIGLCVSNVGKTVCVRLCVISALVNIRCALRWYFWTFWTVNSFLTFAWLHSWTVHYSKKLILFHTKVILCLNMEKWKKSFPNFMMSWIWYWVILYVLYTKIRCSGFEPQI